MLLRLLPLTGLAAITTLALTPRADAAGAWLPSGPTTPLEERVAVSVGPTRSTLWTSLRVDAAQGPFAIIVPVSPGASLDHSSDAWLEALASATTPRVFPPPGVEPACPGEAPNPDADPFHVTDDLGATKSLAPAESVLLQDVSSVLAWSSQHGFELSSDVVAALEGMSDKRFFVERYAAPSAPFVTSTLRVVSPAKDPVIPLALTRAGSADLRVTAWMIGKGKATLAGSEALTLPTNELAWNVGSGDSNYATLREGTLVGGGPNAVLIEAASHASLVSNVPIANGTGSVTGVVTSFFQRAATYGDGNTSAPCITAAAVALDNVYPVAESCPRAELGVVGGGATCVEAPTGAQVDPAKLRCGGITDDLSVALSGLVPKDTVLTRVTLFIPKNETGATWPVTFEPGAADVKPLLTAASLDLATCNGGSSSSGSGAGPGGSSSSGGQGGSSGVGVGAGVGGSAGSGYYENDDYDDDVNCACVGTADPIIDDTTEPSDDGYYDDTSSDDCSGDTTDTSDDGYYDDTSSDDCSGDTTDTSDDGYYEDTSSSDDCSGDTSDDGYYEDTSSDDCSGDTSDDSSSSDSCSGDTDDGGDDWSDDSSDWDSDWEARASKRTDRRSATIDVSRHDDASSLMHHAPAKKMRKRGPKASVITLGLLAILAPLRRLARPDRSRRGAKDKPRRERSSP